MLRPAIAALIISTSPALADGCADYLDQKQANADLIAAVMSAQINITILTATHKMTQSVKDELTKATDTLGEALQESVTTIKDIAVRSECR